MGVKQYKIIPLSRYKKANSFVLGICLKDREQKYYHISGYGLKCIQFVPGWLCPGGRDQTFRWNSLSTHHSAAWWWARFWKAGPCPPLTRLPLCWVFSQTAAPQSVISGQQTLTTIFATLINSACRRRKLYSNILICYGNQSVQITTFLRICMTLVCAAI